MAERLMVVVIALFGYLGALLPIKTILDFLSSTAFSAYAIMAPLFFGGLYSKHIGKKSVWNYGRPAKLVASIPGFVWYSFPYVWCYRLLSGYSLVSIEVEGEKYYPKK